jgi:hypothetical protein
MAGLKREARLRAYVPAIHVFAKRIENKTWMPGIADKCTQSAHRLLWPGMTKVLKKSPRGGRRGDFLYRIAGRLSYFKTIAVNG